MTPHSPMGREETIYVCFTADEAKLMDDFADELPAPLAEALRQRAPGGDVGCNLTINEIKAVADCIAAEWDYVETEDENLALDRLQNRIIKLLALYEYDLSAEDSTGPTPDSATAAHEFFTTPHAEFNGLQPLQVVRLTTVAWGGEHPAIRLNDSLSLDELQGASILHNARMMLSMLNEAGSTKLTAKGNLPRKIVAPLAKSWHLPSEVRRAFWDFHGLRNEQDCWELHVLRMVLQIGGLLRKAKGALTVTRKAKALLDDGQAGRLYTHLFRTFFGALNLACLDGYAEESYPQEDLPFSLHVVATRLGDWTLTDDILEDMYLPPHWFNMLGPLAHDVVLTAQQRVLWPLVQFGLLEIREEREQPLPSFRQLIYMRKTDLFDRFITFDLDVELPGMAR